MLAEVLRYVVDYASAMALVFIKAVSITYEFATASLDLTKATAAVIFVTEGVRIWREVQRGSSVWDAMTNVRERVSDSLVAIGVVLLAVLIFNLCRAPLLLWDEHERTTNDKIRALTEQHQQLSAEATLRVAFEINRLAFNGYWHLAGPGVPNPVMTTPDGVAFEMSPDGEQFCWIEIAANSDNRKFAEAMSHVTESSNCRVYKLIRPPRQAVSDLQSTPAPTPVPYIIIDAPDEPKWISWSADRLKDTLRSIGLDARRNHNRQPFAPNAPMMRIDLGSVNPWS